MLNLISTCKLEKKIDKSLKVSAINAWAYWQRTTALSQGYITHPSTQTIFLRTESHWFEGWEYINSITQFLWNLKKASIGQYL